MPGITELEDDVFPNDFIPVLAAAYDDDPQYDGDDEDAAPAEWRPPMAEWRPPTATVTALRPYRPNVSPISPASPMAIPPANFLLPPPASPMAIPPANFLLPPPPASPITISPANFLMEAPPPPPAPFYSPVSDDDEPAEEEPMVAASGGGGAAGSYLQYDVQDLVNGTHFVDVCRLSVVCLSVCRHAEREYIDKRVCLEKNYDILVDLYRMRWC